MIDFNRKPQKSEQELEFEALNKQYEEKFGKPFCFSIGVYSPTWEETLKDIKKCLETGEEQVIPKYDNDFIY